MGFGARQVRLERRYVVHNLSMLWTVHNRRDVRLFSKRTSRILPACQSRGACFGCAKLARKTDHTEDSGGCSDE